MSEERETPRVLDTTMTGTAEVVAAEQDPREARIALVIYSGDSTEVLRLSGDHPVVIGRDFPSHVQIDDRRISRQHARFAVSGGRVRVEDLNSRNGTLVNGARIKETEVTPGDTVQLGSVRIGVAVSRIESPSSSADGAGDAVILRDSRVIEAYAVARRAARTDAPVLVLGETGTGKEHLARTVHTDGPRAESPFRTINCGAIPASLVESTLFGHERGAFTGADKRTRGLFEDAAGGTVFLDEVAELSPAAQAALLRVLETKTFHRVGSTQELTADVRIVAATHCDLDAAVAAGHFRRDLLYRINTVTLELPPLRERSAELEPLIERFLDDCRRQWGVTVEAVEPDALELLRSYEWPGNIRQLRNAIERGALVAPARSLRVADLPPYLREPGEPRNIAAAPLPQTAPAAPAQSLDPDAGLKPALREYESHIIQRALARTGGNRVAAAKLLRVPRRTLYRRMHALGFALAGEDSGAGVDIEAE